MYDNLNKEFFINYSLVTNRYSNKVTHRQHINRDYQYYCYVIIVFIIGNYNVSFSDMICIV